MQQVWETDYIGDTRTLHVHVSWLRKVLGEERVYKSGLGGFRATGVEETSLRNGLKKYL